MEAILKVFSLIKFQISLQYTRLWIYKHVNAMWKPCDMWNVNAMEWHVMLIIFNLSIQYNYIIRYNTFNFDKYLTTGNH